MVIDKSLLIRLFSIVLAMALNPAITDLKMAAVNYEVDHNAENALDVLVPLDVGKCNNRRSVEEIALNETKGDMEEDNITLPETTFESLNVDETHDMYNECFSNNIKTDPKETFKRYTRSHADFQQFEVSSKVLDVQKRVIFGMYITTLSAFFSEHPVDIGDWINEDHPFLSMGQAMFGNESFACRFSSLVSGIVADQERYKQTILAVVESFEEFESLEDDDVGTFSAEEYKFFEEMRREKLASDDAMFRDMSVRNVFIKFSPCILGKCRETKFQKNCSKELIDWSIKLVRLNSRIKFHIIGSRESHFKRRVFKASAGVNRALFRNCIKLFSIVDQNAKES